MDPDWPGVTDAQWNAIAYAVHWFVIPKMVDRRRKKRGGRPRVPDRTVFNALAWAMGGGTLDRLPRRFGSRKTVERRLREWSRTGAEGRLWQFYVERLRPEEAAVWALRLARRPKRLPFWQELNKVTFRNAHPDPFTRLAACQAPPPGALSAASPPPSSTPESPSRESSGP